MTISFDDALTALRAADDLLILTHRKPDGDTLGSAAALCLGLRQLGKRAYLYYNEDITARFIPMVKDLWAPEGYQPQYIMAVDVADRALLAPGAPENIALAIDHHPSHRPFADALYCDGGMAACGEIIYRLLKALGCVMDKAIADAIYTAAATDTGCFRFNNTTAHTHMVAAECLEAGADFREINYRCFRLKTRARVALEGLIYSNMTLCGRDGAGAVAVITREDIQRLGADDDDLDNLSSLLSEIEGIRIAALLTEVKTRDAFKVSMRSGVVNVSEICARFGGGGHAGAAGCTINEKDAQKAAAIIIKAVEGGVDA